MKTGVMTVEEVRRIVLEVLDEWIPRIKVEIYEDELGKLRSELGEHITKVWEAINELVEAQKRTEQRVEELAEAQKRTEEAQQRTEERLSRLEKAVVELAEAQKRTEQRLEELAEAQKRTEEAQQRTEERLSRLENAVAELAEAQKRTEDAVDKLMAAHTLLSQKVENLAVAVGSLSETIGFGLEDVAKLMLPPYLERHYGIHLEGEPAEELGRQFFNVEGKYVVEVNLYGEGYRDGNRVIVLGECKSRIGGGAVQHFVEMVAEKVEPLVRSKGEVWRVMFGFYIHPSAWEVAKKHNVILVASYQR